MEHAACRLGGQVIERLISLTVQQHLYVGFEKRIVYRHRMSQLLSCVFESGLYFDSDVDRKG